MKPIEPFEHLQSIPGFDAPRLSRPLLYFFQHQVLPQGFLGDHPAMEPALFEGSTLTHFWSRSAAACVARGIWSEQLIFQGLATDYIAGLSAHVSLKRQVTDDHEIWLTSMRPPLSTLEAHFAALCRPLKRDPRGDAKQGRRYFLLEKTVGEQRACLCEWIGAEHRNLGEAATLDDAHFLQAVIARLA